MRRWWRVGGVLLLAPAAVLPPVLLLQGGISARPDPGALEVGVARRLRSLLIPPATVYLRDQKPTTRDRLVPGERVVVKGRDATGNLEATTVSGGGDKRHDH